MAFKIKSRMACLRGFGVSWFWGFVVLGFWGFGVLGFGVLGFRGFGVLGFWGFWAALRPLGRPPQAVPNYPTVRALGSRGYGEAKPKPYYQSNSLTTLRSSPIPNFQLSLYYS